MDENNAIVFPPNDQLLASAVQFLIGADEVDAANVLLACMLDIKRIKGYQDFGRWVETIDIVLSGPRGAFDVLTKREHPTAQAIEAAINAVVPAGALVETIIPRAQIIDIDPDWRVHMLHVARGGVVDNQGVQIGSAPVVMWNNLRFRSQSEVRIARALDGKSVLFLPNCMARLTTDTGRHNREADFLVCVEGKWGILEVDGEPYHPPTRTVQDHERDRLFRLYGIRVVEHFDAAQCYNAADRVVNEFLELLRRS